MIIVLGGVTGRPETIDRLRTISLEHVHRSRLEPGCLSHDVLVDAENPLRLVFVERWEDQAALDLHFTVPDSLAFVGELTDLADGRPTMHVHPVP